MFEKLKRIFRRNKEEKPLVLCIHGFGQRRSMEYDNFVLWGKESYDFVTFDIFDVDNKEDVDAKVWLERCEKQMLEALSTKRKVHVIGFSMGGVIASYLASKYDVEKLILLAPAFEYISFQMVVQVIQKRIMPNKGKEFQMSDLQVKAFMDIVSMCKDSITEVTCPVLFIQGDKDEVIPLRSSINALDKVKHEEKRLIILHGGPHRLMLFEGTRNETYQLFDLFMKDLIITYQPEVAPDPIGDIETIEEL